MTANGTKSHQKKPQKAASGYNPYLCFLQRTFFLIRWNAFGKFFQWKILSQNYLPLRNIPGLRHLPFVSVGEALLAIPLIVLFFYGIDSTFINPDPVDSGFIAYWCIVTAFLLANKSTSAVSVILGLSWERIVPFHYCAAVLGFVFSLLHGYVAFMAELPELEGENQRDLRRGGHKSHHRERPKGMFRGFNPPVDQIFDMEGAETSRFSFYGTTTNAWKYLWDGPINISGTVMTICITLLIMTSAVRWLRRVNFNLWLFVHIFLSVTIVTFSLVHAPSTTKLIFLWWGLDAFVRHIVQGQCLSPKTAQLKKLLPDLVEIRFERPRTFRFRSGQFIRIAVHELGALKFHPATISSAPHEDFVTVHFRTRGDWTKKLVKLAESCDEARISVQGPFGNLSMFLDDYDRYKRVVMVCGGIGATPMLSLTKHLLYAQDHLYQPRTKIHLIWANPDPALPNALRLDRDIGTCPLLKQMLASRRGVDVFPDVDSSSKTMRSSDSSVFSDSSSDVEVGSSECVFKGDIFITRKGKLRLNWSDNRCSVHYAQRPDIDDILRDYTSTDGHVAVIACGPAALVEATKVACRKRSSPCISFDFHEEVFDY